MAIHIFNIPDPPTYFFEQGLLFECHQCGTCCTGAPGTVYVDSEEIEAIAFDLNLARSEFIQHYLFPYKDSYSIRENSDGACIFFNRICTIYPIRPHQCRTYPFWFCNLRSESQWQQTRFSCPGIGQGRLYSKKQLLASIRSTMHI